MSEICILALRVFFFTVCYLFVSPDVVHKITAYNLHLEVMWILHKIHGLLQVINVDERNIWIAQKSAQGTHFAVI